MKLTDGDNPFESDAKRAEIARRGDMHALRNFYYPGVLPELEDMSTSDLWDDLASLSGTPAFRLRRLQAVADRVPSGATVLDIGVGWGEIIPMLRKRNVASYTGIDFSEKVVGRVSARFPDCKFYLGGLEQIRDRHDVVLALEVCEHILPSKIMGFYAEILRVLKHDGYLIISVPLNEDLQAITLRCPHCGHMHSRMGHVRAYTPELIRAELALAGFDVLDSFVHYASFSLTLGGRLKRFIVDIGRHLLGMGRTLPLGIVVVATPAAKNAETTADNFGSK